MCIVGVLEPFGGGVAEQAVQAVVVVPVDVVGGEGLDIGQGARRAGREAKGVIMSGPAGPA